MLQVGVFLIAVVCYSGDEPVLWGSRVVGTPHGSPLPMHFRLPGGLGLRLLTKDNVESPISITEGVCHVNDSVWGKPCNNDAESTNVTVNDTSKQKALLLVGERGPFATAVFVPNCSFPKPEAGHANLQTWFPLSRFRKGHSHVEVKFAVGGASHQSLVGLLVYKVPQCY
ncbi:hypothetical protein TcWFU_002471 [Taenia crassiceps]|uniref:DUF5727 domain-containing protein n=1 Tax=Taenia crassiceps TaxID=6207 RepID=A0ABR4Q270_9CEST